MTTSPAPTVVLVHGAFADASGFRGVIRELQTAGHSVVAPPNPLRSLAFDAAAIAAHVGAIDGPVVLVGHSYGGAVITQASAGLDNVAGLVYLAAFSLDVGESCASVQQPFPPSLLASTSYPTAFDAPGAPRGPDLYINRERFRETFCADVPVDTAEAMFATQRPLSLAALTENATAAGWKTKPSWYLVSENDNAIPPDAERFMAERMGATTKSLAGSHTVFIAQPRRRRRVHRRGPPRRRIDQTRRGGIAMTTRTTAIDHPSRRLVVALPQTYDEAREHYESLVPEVDFARFSEMTSWQATLELAEINAPHGFMRYYRSDITGAMSGSPSFWKTTQYLMGNHTIAERIFRHDPSVMLHAPLRTVLYVDPDGDTKLAVDQPSLLFDSYDKPEIAAVGRELDGLLAGLITALGGDMPPQLGTEMTATGAT
jgi:pimeloyl-ACP methyl ester carboxylesterase